MMPPKTLLRFFPFFIFLSLYCNSGYYASGNAPKTGILSEDTGVLYDFSKLKNSNVTPESHPDFLEQLNSILNDTSRTVTASEVYLSLLRDELKKNMQVLKYLSIDYFENGRVFAYCNEATLQMLIESGINYQIEKSPGDVDFNLNMTSWEQLLAKDHEHSWDFYPTYDAYENMMYQFEADFPGICKIYNAGTLPGGRSLLFAKISSDVNENKMVPRFMYTSTMHGDETTGFVLLLRLIDYLLNNYGDDETVTNLLDNIEIWICPNENPDGTYTNDNSTVNGATRGNANGIDLNRNYPNPVVSPVETLQHETRAMIRLTDSLNFVMSANIHGGIECVNFPFDSWKSAENKHADHFWWTWVSHEYADTARYYSPSAYMNPTGPSFNNGVSHGGDWYVIHGSRQDYFNYYSNQRELTLELSGTKLLHPSELPAHWEYNYRSLLNYMNQSKFGIRGIVTDHYTGKPLSAKIEIPGYDKDNSHVYSSLPFGDYYRPIAAGKYNLEFSANGYHTYVSSEVDVKDYSSVSYNVQLIHEDPFAPPTELIATVDNFDNVHLSWLAPENPFGYETKTEGDHLFYAPDYYRIFRNGHLIDEVIELSFLDQDLATGAYDYFVQAYYSDFEGVSSSTETVSISIDEAVYFTISAIAGENGVIYPSGDIQVKKGRDAVFIITPDEGFFISDVLINGNHQGLSDTCTFRNIQSDHTLEVSFDDIEKSTYTLTFLVRDLLEQSIDDAKVTFNGKLNEAGDYEFSLLAPRTYAYSVSREYFYTSGGTVEIIDQDVIEEVVLVNDFANTLIAGNPNEYSLYPNPATDWVYIESSDNVKEVYLVDLSGRKIKQRFPDSKRFSISLDGLQTGIYFVVIYSESESYAHKLQVHQRIKK